MVYAKIVQRCKGQARASYRGLRKWTQYRAMFLYGANNYNYRGLRMPFRTVPSNSSIAQRWTASPDLSPVSNPRPVSVLRARLVA